MCVCEREIDRGEGRGGENRRRGEKKHKRVEVWREEEKTGGESRGVEREGENRRGEERRGEG